MCPFLVHFLAKHPQARRVMLLVGVATVVAGSVGAGFSSTPTQLILTQGALYGMGSGLVFAPNMSLIDEWFLRRRSLAYGIYFASSSLSAAIIPPVLRMILQKYSAKATLVGWGVFVAVVLSVTLLGVRPRLSPPSDTRSGDESGTRGVKAISYSFFRTPLFWLVIISNVLQALSQYLPAVYIPSFATEVTGSSSAAASVLLTIYNVSSALFQPFIGIFA